MSEKNRLILGLSLATAIGFGALLDRYADIYDRHIPVDLKQGIVNVPIYNIFNGLAPFHCSAYVRKAAEDIFGIDNYTKTDAWNRIHDDRLVAMLSEFSDLEKLLDSGKILPGSIVGLRYENSEYLDGDDKNGNPRMFNHVALVLGQTKSGEVLFAHQEGWKTHIDTSSNLKRGGYQIKAVVAPKDQ